VQVEQNSDLKSTPALSNGADGDSSRLIDDGMLYYEASLAGANERYTRGKTQHTIHVWWARRPHSAMRALIYASLCKTINPATLSRLTEIGKTPNLDEEKYAEIRKTLESSYGGAPRVLDMFGGGGTIPLEAAALGAETYSCDSNELAAFILKNNLEYSQILDRDQLVEQVKTSGQNVLNRLLNKSNVLYPLRTDRESSDSKALGYLWSYSTICTNCKKKLIVSARPWVAKKKNRTRFLGYRYTTGSNGQNIELEEYKPGEPIQNTPRLKNGSLICQFCGHTHDKLDVKTCTDELTVVIRDQKSSGKLYSNADSDAIPSEERLQGIEKQVLQDIDFAIPQSEMPKWSGIVNPASYGMIFHSDSFNKRQRIVLLMLIRELVEEYEILEKTKSEMLAKSVIGSLSSLIDQVVDWNCRLSMWISQNEQVGRAFSGPGVPMLWDYAEMDQLQGGPANLWSKLDRIIEGVKSIPHFPITPHTKQSNAQTLPYDSNFFDAIITDPPYYDNIFYTVLADFFFVWKAPLIQRLISNYGETLQTTSTHELVASLNRSGSRAKAHADYCDQLTQAINEAARVLKKDGIFTLVYGHASILGWLAIVEAYRNSSLQISSIQPLSIERKARPRAMSSMASNTCFAIIARHVQTKPTVLSYSEFMSRIENEFIPFALSLKEYGWSDEDAGMVVFANSIGLIANSAMVEGHDNERELLVRIRDNLKKTFSKISISNREPI